MSRTAIVVISGLFVLGCIVALLPAEESSSRRTASRFRGAETPAPPTSAQSNSVAPGSSYPASDSPASLPPNSLPAMPPATLAPLEPGEQAPAPLSVPATSATGRLVGNGDQPAATASDQAAPPATATERPAVYSPPSTSAAAPSDDGALHSVLKRSAQPAPVVSAPPPATTESSELPSLPRAGGSSRLSAAPIGSSRRAAPSGGNTVSKPIAIGAGSPSRSIQDMNIAGRSPSLRLEVTGPQGITVGKPAAYVVHIVNEGDTPAEDVLVRAALPSWITVKSTQPTSGESGIHNEGAGAARLLWSLPRIAPRGHEQLKLQLLTTEGDAFELALEWASKPTMARASITVRQPKLHLALAGPANMTFGEEKSYTLSVTNPGNGDAEHVVVAVSSGNSPPQQIEVGSIPAGYKKELALQVVASQAGEMELHAVASGDGNLNAETSGKITVRKAEVVLAIDGPPLKYAGTEAVYAVTVANQGTAPAENVSLALTLPSGAKYLGGIDGAAAGSGNLKWKIASLAAGADRTYEVRVQLSAPGVNRLAVQAQATASGSTSATAETEVQAVSDLKLVVNDPSGPVGTGDPAVYEIQVMNRGSQAAQHVRIVMQFSSGIEPISFDGCEARIVPGQVVCQPLTELGAGEQVTLRVKATAQQAGSHQFRVEVNSAEGDSRLVTEGTTRFFVDGGRTGSAAATTAKRPSLLPTAEGTLHR